MIKLVAEFKHFDQALQYADWLKTDFLNSQWCGIYKNSRGRFDVLFSVENRQDYNILRNHPECYIPASPNLINQKIAS